MASPGPIRYAGRGPGTRVAYRVAGKGERTIVQIGGSASHQDMLWEQPDFRRLWQGIADGARVITLDRRGTGLSDPLPDPPALDDHVADILAVLDEVGVRAASLFAASEAGRVTIATAARHPERVDRLVLFGPSVSHEGLDAETIEAFGRHIEQNWGEGRLVGMWSPSRAADERYMAWAAVYERACARPADAARILRFAMTTDVSDELANVRAPTLVLHRRGDAIMPIAGGRAVAAGIPGATFVELPGTDSLAFSEDVDTVRGHVERFLLGDAFAGRPTRALLTVLFTDIVGSTALAASLGDRRWSELLAGWDSTARAVIERHDGTWIKSTGDGALVTFASPDQALDAALDLARESRGAGCDVRTGVHTGQCERRPDGDVGGLAVHVAARVSALADAGEVLTSGTVQDLMLGSDLEFAPRGERELKGVPGSWRLFALADGRSPATIDP